MKAPQAKEEIEEKFFSCQLAFTHILYSRNNLFLECYVVITKKEASISSLWNSYSRRNKSIICLNQPYIDRL